MDLKARVAFAHPTVQQFHQLSFLCFRSVLLLLHQAYNWSLISQFALLVALLVYLYQLRASILEKEQAIINMKIEKF